VPTKAFLRLDHDRGAVEFGRVATELPGASHLARHHWIAAILLKDLHASKKFSVVAVFFCLSSVEWK
jgi:hypothetical protein